MNTALIFAGGTGSRMQNDSIPKQFLEYDGKSVIVHTVMNFQVHPEIDNIVVVCIKDWIERFKSDCGKFGLSKVISVIPGGSSGLESIRLGLYEIQRLAEVDDDQVIVLIHDGVRPLINSKLISDNIKCVKENGNAITVVPAIETIIEIDDKGNIDRIADRSNCRLARAPQSFILSDILNAHRMLLQDGNSPNFIDSAMLMEYYGATLHTVEGPSENIKITTPIDFALFKTYAELKKELS